MAAVKKKRWFKLVAPKAFRNAVIGEVPSVESEKLVGKNAKVNAMYLLSDPRKQNLRLTFKVKEVKADQAQTELYGYEIVTSQLKRYARKGQEKIDDSFTAKTKDGAVVRLKPVMSARGKVSNSVATAIRKSVRETLTKDLAEKNYDDFILDVISSKAQRSLKDSLKKIHPMGQCEFRKIIKE